MTDSKPIIKASRLKEGALLLVIGICIGVFASYSLSDMTKTNGYRIDGELVTADGDPKIEMLINEMKNAEKDLQEREYVLLYNSSEKPLNYFSKIEPYYVPLAVARRQLAEAEQFALQNHISQAREKLLQTLSTLQAAQLFSDRESKKKVIELSGKVRDAIHDIELTPRHANLNINALVINNDVLLLRGD
jgi:hypothetical protein